jgi:hypothetical protein
MTFIVAEDAAVYEKDLGRQNAAIAKGMPKYDRTSGWHQGEDVPEQAAAPGLTRLRTEFSVYP